VRVLKSLADAFNLSTETLLEQAGLLDDEETETPTRKPRSGPTRG
jgi:hypothetical protein